MPTISMFYGIIISMFFEIKVEPFRIDPLK
jgi:hypothetical protein